MKLRLFARRMSVSAPKMTVRKEVSWPVRLLMLLGAALLGAIVAVLSWKGVYGDAAADRETLQAQLSFAQSELAKEKSERERLTEIANKSDAQIKVEKATSEQLAKQLKALEADNGKLLADVSYLETLLPADGAAGSVAIRRLTLEKDIASQPGGAQQVRYKALVMQGGREQREFAGAIQIIATGTLNGKPYTLTLPDQGPPEVKDRMKIAFKRYQRIEGFVEIPPGVVLKTIQLRLLEKGTLRAQETASL